MYNEQCAMQLKAFHSAELSGTNLKINVLHFIFLLVFPILIVDSNN